MSASHRWTQQDVRNFVLSLPETTEAQHRGRPDLRVRNKILATLPEDGGTVNLKTTPIALDMLLRSGEEIYRDVWGGQWVGVTLALADPGEIEELLVEAYCLAAPRTLGNQLREVRRS